MYFKTKRTSETGLKFQKIEDRINEMRKAENEISTELGFKQWIKGNWLAFGGFSQ